MDKRIQQALQILQKEIEKDKMEVENYKKRTIDEIKNYNKTEMFVKKKVSIIDKILKIFGYGKKR
jgi:hypothetical protein